MQREPRVYVKATVAVVAVSVALVSASAVRANVETTAPSNKVTVLVVIDDKGIRVNSFVQLGNETPGKDEENEPSSMQALQGAVPRGDLLTFNVFNRGKKVHDFTIFGKKTPPIRPGRKAHFSAQAVVRGSFAYRSTLDKSRAFRGYFKVL